MNEFSETARTRAPCVKRMGRRDGPWTCSAKAEVNAVPERDVRVGIARDVEAVRVRKALRVAIG